MKITSMLRTLVAGGAFALASLLSAQEITFDDLPGSLDVVPAGYAGLQWDNVYFANVPSLALGPTGYSAGTVSGTQVALNGFEAPASFFSTSFKFNLDHLYLTGAWNDGQQVQLDGYLNGSLLYSLSLVVNSTSPSLVQPGFLGIDTVVIATYGGVPNPDYYSGGGAYLAIDNVQVTPVPEPSTYGLIGAVSLAGVGLWRRRTRRS